ncbi:hypothetical protein [Kaistella polysaccharea]|uniref:hypothetical protein n=1 Tax=Kaistella polysaccharea TaxID=2878534 RepID=UPI001CF2D605|nr:hypothetical protein [Kaistella polysaccharea]
MKKMSLLAAFGVAGMMSASNAVAESSIINWEVKKDTNGTKSAVVVENCFPVTYSCGTTENYCVDSGISMEIILAFIMFDDYLECGGN